MGLTVMTVKTTYVDFINVACEEPIEVTVKTRYVVTVDGETSEYDSELKTYYCKQSLLIVH